MCHCLQVITMRKKHCDVTTMMKREKKIEILRNISSLFLFFLLLNTFVIFKQVFFKLALIY